MTVMQPFPESETHNPYKYELAAVAVSKREDRNLREWVEYHRMIGVQHFYIHDEGSDNARKALQPYIDQGIVSYFEEKRHPCQWEVYREHMFEKPQQEKWLAIMDIDEFFVPKKHDDLRLWLRDFETRSIAGVGVAWTIFGSSHHKTRPEGLIIENFTKCVNYRKLWHDRWIKSIVRPDRLQHIVDDPHYFKPLGGFRMVDPEKNAIDISQHKHDYPTKDIQLNHYICKSYEDWVNKIRRGSADKYHLDPTRNKKLSDWTILDSVACTGEDFEILRFRDVLKKRLDLINSQFPVTYKPF